MLRAMLHWHGQWHHLHLTLGWYHGNICLTLHLHDILTWRVPLGRNIGPTFCQHGPLTLGARGS